MPDLVLLDHSDGVATITLNRPERLNAFADDMRECLAAALDDAAGSPARVLVVTGAGRAFCAGGDVRHMADLKGRGDAGEGVQRLLDAGRAVIERLVALPIPTIAAVNGAAAGAGLNLALACDLRIASDQASFTQSFVRIGLHPDWGGTFHLPRAVGLAKALEMCWLGDPIDAAEALRLGLVGRVVAGDRLAEEPRELARRLAEAPATSVRRVKRNLRAAFVRTLAECMDAEAAAQAACWRSPDVAEGLQAFVEKRAPRFGGAEPVGTDAPPSPAARRFE